MQLETLLQWNGQWNGFGRLALRSCCECCLAGSAAAPCWAAALPLAQVVLRALAKGTVVVHRVLELLLLPTQVVLRALRVLAKGTVVVHRALLLLLPTEACPLRRHRGQLHLMQLPTEAGPLRRDRGQLQLMQLLAEIGRSTVSLAPSSGHWSRRRRCRCHPPLH